MKTIDQIYSELLVKFTDNPTLLSDVKKHISLINHNIFDSSMNDANGYCMKFKIPTNKIDDLFRMLSINDSDLLEAITHSWKLPTNQRMVMYGNPFYHILLLLLLYAIKNNEESFRDNLLNIILFRIWNGRLNKAIQYCDVNTMNYVINYMLTKRSLVKKYNEPYSLITSYFTPTLIKTYATLINNNSDNMKQLFNQCYVRINQIFYQSFGVDLITKVNKAKSGIAPLYYKAREEGKNISSMPSQTDQTEFGSSLSSSDYGEIISTILDNIILNKYQDYEDSFINMISKSEKMNREGITKLINSIHSIEYEKYLHDIIVLMITIINPTMTSEICSNTFYDRYIKPKLISSKHNPQITALRQVLNQFLIAILQKYSLDYNQYSMVRQAQFRNVLIYILSYNIQKYICTNHQYS